MPNKILIVDDESGVLRLCEQVLRILPDVEISLEGQSSRAADRITNESFDLIIVDIRMPQMTGMELHEHVKARHPELAARFVFVTGGAFADKAAEFLRTTPNPWVEKPFDSQVLRDALVRTVGHE